MMAGLSLSAAFCRAATSSTARKGVVVLAEGDLGTIELLLDVVVPVEVIRGLKGKERRHPHDHGPEHFVADVEIVVSEAALLAGQDTVIGILGRELRHGHPERRSLFHALEDEEDAVSVLAHHFPQPRLDMVLLAYALLGPLDGDGVIAGKGLDPVLVVGGPLAQHVFAYHRNADDLAEEMH